MPQVNSRWRCSNRCEAAKRWVEYPDHIFVDRIDIQIEIVPVPFDKISDQRQGESSNIIRQRVIKARQIQERRYTEYTGIYCNAQMNSNCLQCMLNQMPKGSHY